jgi:preprotein translocase subunit YajC
MYVISKKNKKFNLFSKLWVGDEVNIGGINHLILDITDSFIELEPLMPILKWRKKRKNSVKPD